ncbi:tyrosine-type recombinase/integrase [Nocardioides caricicola]|uniref:Tyrosine-type recombinase/integrase n=1 Tax=Nocardioides caricicola TaxID=634770 RepID=A0ABW0N5P7_9ACTN
MGAERLQPGEFGDPWFNDRHSEVTSKGRPRANPMTSEQIKNDPKARWEAYVRYRDHSGRYRELFGSGPTKGAARRSLERKVETTRHSMGATGDLDARTSVETLARSWLAERREKGQGRHQTLVKYEQEVDKAIVQKWGGLAIGTVTTERLHRGLGEIEKTRSTRQTRTVLSQVFGYAVALGALKANPMQGLPSEITPRGRRKKRKATPRSLTPEETSAVLAAVAEWEKPNPGGGPRPSGVLSLAVEVMLATGCRIGECLAIEWRDVHLDDEMPWVRIAATLVEPSRKGDPTLHRQAFTKGDQEEDDEPGRDVALSPQAAAALHAHRKRTPYRRQVDPVFANRTGGWLWPGNVRRMLRTAAERHAPEVTDLHPHLFRSTVATVVSETYGVEVAQEMLGHTNGATTQRYYVAKKRRVVHGQDAVVAWRAGASPN